MAREKEKKFQRTMKVVVLGGGPSSEREISLRSAGCVRSALEKAGFTVSFLDPSQDDSYLSQKEMVFPILHGKFGEDGTVQQMLEKKGIPYLGSDSVSSANSFNKVKTRELLDRAGIKIPKGDFISREEYKQHELVKRPHVLKIPDGGSSIGTYIVRKAEDNKLDLDEVFADGKVLIEELIEGVELTVPILGKEALPVIEIQPPEDGEFDYENKYNGKSSEICPPVSIDESRQDEIQKLAEKVHKIMGCRHLSRVDFMLDNQGQAYVLEINTMPGMTDQSLYPLSADKAGISMPELMKKFYDIVVRDYSLD
jgi:D-alanine-D-alanine ligase